MSAIIAPNREIKPRRQDWPAEGLSGKKTGNFAELLAEARKRARISKQIRSVTAKFPARRNRELLSLEQGILSNRTGDAWRNQGIIFAHKREYGTCSSVSYLRVSTGKQAQAVWDYPKERGAVMADVVRKCWEDGLRGPKPPLSMDAARLGSARADAIVAIDGRISARSAASQCQ